MACDHSDFLVLLPIFTAVCLLSCQVSLYAAGIKLLAQVLDSYLVLWKLLELPNNLTER